MKSMNLSLTINCGTIQELLEVLGGQAATATATAKAPAKKTAVKKTAAKPTLVPDVAIADPLDLTPATPAEEAGGMPIDDMDAEELRATLMAKLRELAGSLPDNTVLGKFINGFGVSRFSEIDDEDLADFAVKLEAEYG
jgi:hypothetical protein